MAADSWGYYFDRICDVIRAPQCPDPLRYFTVLWHLHNTTFYPVIFMDRNRVQDALAFRRRFILIDLGHPVGVLEVMVALAERLETDIMSGTVDHDRTAEWFWSMFECLGLLDSSDEVYDERYVDGVLSRFINRKYSKNGRGGLFSVNDPSIDMREYELWFQAALYLNAVLREEGVLDAP